MTRIVVIKERLVVILIKIIVIMKGRIVMVGNIKGFNIVRVTAKKLNKNENFGKLFTESEAAENAMNKAFESKGTVYALLDKDKACISLYCFEKQSEEDSKHHKLVMTCNMFADGYDSENEEFAKVLHKEISELLLLTEVDKCEWDGETLTPKSSDSNSELMFAVMYTSLAVMLYSCMGLKPMAYCFGAAALIYFISALSKSSKKLKTSGSEENGTKENI